MPMRANDRDNPVITRRRLVSVIIRRRFRNTDPLLHSPVSLSFQIIQELYIQAEGKYDPSVSLASKKRLDSANPRWTRSADKLSRERWIVFLFVLSPKRRTHAKTGPTARIDFQIRNSSIGLLLALPPSLLSFDACSSYKIYFITENRSTEHAIRSFGEESKFPLATRYKRYPRFFPVVLSTTVQRHDILPDKRENWFPRESGKAGRVLSSLKRIGEPIRRGKACWLISKRRSNALCRYYTCTRCTYTTSRRVARRQRWEVGGGGGTRFKTTFHARDGAKNGEMFVRFTSYRVNHACARYRCAITMRTNKTYAIRSCPLSESPSNHLFPTVLKPPPIHPTYEHISTHSSPDRV